MLVHLAPVVRQRGGSMPTDPWLGKKLRVGERIHEHNRSPRPKLLSARKCSIHGTKQRRVIHIEGPLHEGERTVGGHRVKDIRKEFPRNSDQGFWGSWGIGWLVCPPSYKEPDNWFVIELEAFCPDCDADETVGTVVVLKPPFHPEKWYRRKYGRFGFCVMKFKSSKLGSFLFGSHIFTEHKPYTGS